MNIFIRANHKYKGIDRFLSSLSIHGQCKVRYINDINEASHHYDDIVVFGGFLPQEVAVFKQINKRFKNIYTTFCSPFGQADLNSSDFYSPEIIQLMNVIKLREEGYVTNVFTQSKSLFWRFGFAYIPPARIIPVSHKIFNKDRHNYGFLGNNLRKHKNVANQLAAISKLEPKEPIVVSDARLYEHYSKLFDCEFISKKPNDDGYFNEIASHRLNFECSHSEAFDYVVLEYALMGVPSIVAPCIDWYIGVDEDSSEFYSPIVVNIDNPSEIYLRANSLLNDGMYWEFSQDIQNWAWKFNESQGNLLYETIEKILHE